MKHTNRAIKCRFYLLKTPGTYSYQWSSNCSQEVFLWTTSFYSFSKGGVTLNWLPWRVLHSKMYPYCWTRHFRYFRLHITERSQLKAIPSLKVGCDSTQHRVQNSAVWII